MSRSENPQSLARFCQRRLADDSPCTELAMEKREVCPRHLREVLAKMPSEFRADEDFDAVGEIAPDTELETIEDAMFIVGDTIRRVRRGLLPVRIADQVFKGAKVYLQSWELRKKLDPTVIAQKAYAAELARQAAERVAKDPDMVREILQKRNFMIIDQEIEAIEAEGKIVSEPLKKIEMTLEEFAADRSFQNKLKKYKGDDDE